MDSRLYFTEENYRNEIVRHWLAFHPMPVSTDQIGLLVAKLPVVLATNPVTQESDSEEEGCYIHLYIFFDKRFDIDPAVYCSELDQSALGLRTYEV